MARILAKRGLGLATASVLALTASEALAGGFAIREQSTEGQGASFAGVAAGGSSLGSMFWNPATMSLHDGASVDLNAAVIFPESDIDVTSSTFLSAPGPTYASNGTRDSGNIGEIATVPATYFTYRVNERTNVGLGINAPFGLVTKARRNWSGEFHGLKSDLFSLNINPMISYEITPEITVGVGFQAQYVDVELTQESAVVIPGPAVIYGQGKVEGDDWGFGATAGVLWEPSDYTRIGVGFRSAIKHTLKGKGGVSDTVAGQINLGDIEGDVTLPEMVSLGISHDIDERWTVLGTVEWTNWSRFDELRIQFVSPGSTTPDNVTTEDWDDGWFFALGGEYKWSEDTTLRAGVAYEISPVPDATRTPRVPDNDRYWVSLGATHQVTPRLSVSAAYTHIFVEDAPINQTLADTNNAARGTLVGEVDAHVDIVALSAKWDF